MQKKRTLKNVCRSSASPTKKLGELGEEEEQEEGDAVLFISWRSSNNRGGWIAQLGVNGRNTRFKLDTGAAVTVIGAHTCWLKDQMLVKPNQTLRGPGNIKIPVRIGMFLANLSCYAKTPHGYGQIPSRKPLNTLKQPLCQSKS